MADQTIACPQCKTEIKLTESLAAPLLEAARRDYERRLSEREKLVREEELKRARLHFSAELEGSSRQLQELRSAIEQRNAKLAEAQKAQLAFLQKERALDDQRRELEITLEKRLAQSLTTERLKARTEAEDGMKLRVLEKDQLITAMQKQIEDLRRRAEQGSQQMQGEVLELDLEARLSQRFPFDSIEPVGKGEHGGDILQRVRNPRGGECGTILWETKRTRNWSDGWLVKLREDQRRAKADIAILVSHALPKELENFDQIEGVWVTHPKTMLPLALSLRQSLTELAAVRNAADGVQTKAEIVYGYLTGPRFRHRVQAMAESFTCLQEDLDKERKVMQRQWAKREEQIDRALQATAGMFGDLQGMAGKSIGEIKGLGLDDLDAEPFSLTA